ncbi:MAG: cation:proton antiporter, partial [Pseudomonadota bacterium]
MPFIDAMTLFLVITAIALIMICIALVEAAAARLALPQSLTLAALGVALGLVSLFGGDIELLAPVAALFAAIPISAEGLTLLLLPPLLFHAALKVDARRMVDDAAPIAILAVVAICLTTFAVGFALAPLGLQPLVVCLLVGAIVSTTDPLAVLSIFREVGAPARLVRIIEGESLLNDAAAIALFTVLLLAIEGVPVNTWSGLKLLMVAGVGGAVTGVALAVAFTPLMALTRNHPPALMSVTTALPYLAWIISEEYLGVSGALAVVAAGLVTASRADAGRAPKAWRHTREIWEQVAFWANSLVFVLAAFLAPRLLAGITFEVAIAAVVALAAVFGTRALMLWGLFPVITRLALAESVSHRARVLLLWGGLRGALTLVLALAVTENEAVPDDAQTFVAVLATAITLFTVVVNGATLQPLTHALGLHRLSAFDKQLGQGARALAADTARRHLEVAAADFGIEPSAAEDAITNQRREHPETGSVPVAFRERVELALVVLAQAERTQLTRFGEDSIIRPAIAERLHREAQRLAEAARGGGRRSYLTSARTALDYPPLFRVALAVHRQTGWRGPLAGALADRFELLAARRILLRRLAPFAEARIAPVLGDRVAKLCLGLLDRRGRALSTALDALALQYPLYAAGLEQRLLQRIASQEELREYRMLQNEGLIGTEVSSALDAELRQVNRRLDRALTLDLAVDKRAMVAKVPLFASLPDATLDVIAKALRARLAVPGECIIRRGDWGDSVFFVASGAVEVDTGTIKVRLGPGACVGELAAYFGSRRNADVTMLG